MEKMLSLLIVTFQNDCFTEKHFKAKKVNGAYNKQIDDYRPIYTEWYYT